MKPHATPTPPPDDPAAGAEPVADSSLDDAGASDPPFEDATVLAEQLTKAEAEAAELREAWLRARADTENVRKQAANDVAKAHKFAIEKFAEELLAVKDALESALAAENASAETLRAGCELTLKQLTSAFEKSQIREVAPAGQKFDPNFHQAMAMIESDQPPNTVVNVFQKGYTLNDRVLRPALVAVAKGKD